jgi:hypothetical protein
LFFGCYLFFVLTDSFRCKSFVGVTSFEFSGLLLSLDLLGYMGVLATRPPLCCSLSASVSVNSSSGGVGPPRSERGLHALARVGNVPIFRPSGWCFSGWSAGAGEARVRRVVFHTLVRVVPPSGLAILFMCFSVYSSFLSQFAIVVG